MDAALQRRVQRYGWDKASADYERFWAEQLRPAHDLVLELAALQPGEQVLDVACGTGLVTARAADAVGAAGRVTGIDVSARMIEAARTIDAARTIHTTRTTDAARTSDPAGTSDTACTTGTARTRAGDRQAGHAAPTEFHRMDAEALQFPDAHFDAVVCALGLMYVPDPLRALQEMHRVLRPGGRAAVLVWGERRDCGWADIFPIVDRRVRSEVCPMFFALGSPGALAQTLRQAGFAVTADRRLAAPVVFHSDEEAVGAAFAGGPVALAYSRFDAPTRAEAHAEYLASIAPFRVGGEYHVPGAFVAATGTRKA